MNELFRIRDLVFYKEDFLDNINDFEDIVPIIQDLSNELTYEKSECTGINDCCEKTNENYIVEIQGFINEEDEFITTAEIEALGIRNSIGESQRMILDTFVITVHKCVECNKWVIGILE